MPLTIERESVRDERERKREREREREIERERDSERERETDRERHGERERDRENQCHFYAVIALHLLESLVNTLFCSKRGSYKLRKVQKSSNVYRELKLMTENKSLKKNTKTLWKI